MASHVIKPASVQYTTRESLQRMLERARADMCVLKEPCSKGDESHLRSYFVHAQQVLFSDRFPVHEKRLFYTVPNVEFSNTVQMQKALYSVYKADPTNFCQQLCHYLRHIRKRNKGHEGEEFPLKTLDHKLRRLNTYLNTEQRRVDLLAPEINILDETHPLWYQIPLVLQEVSRRQGVQQDTPMEHNNSDAGIDSDGVAAITSNPARSDVKTKKKGDESHLRSIFLYIQLLQSSHPSSVPEEQLSVFKDVPWVDTNDIPAMRHLLYQMYRRNEALFCEQLIYFVTSIRKRNRGHEGRAFPLETLLHKIRRMNIFLNLERQVSEPHIIGRDINLLDKNHPVWSRLFEAMHGLDKLQQEEGLVGNGRLHKKARMKRKAVEKNAGTQPALEATFQPTPLPHNETPADVPYHPVVISMQQPDSSETEVATYCFTDLMAPAVPMETPSHESTDLTQRIDHVTSYNLHQCSSPPGPSISGCNSVNAQQQGQSDIPMGEQLKEQLKSNLNFAVQAAIDNAAALTPIEQEQFFLQWMERIGDKLISIQSSSSTVKASYPLLDAEGLLTSMSDLLEVLQKSCAVPRLEGGHQHYGLLSYITAKQEQHLESMKPLIVQEKRPTGREPPYPTNSPHPANPTPPPGQPPASYVQEQWPGSSSQAVSHPGLVNLGEICQKKGAIYKIHPKPAEQPIAERPALPGSRYGYDQEVQPQVPVEPLPQDSTQPPLCQADVDWLFPGAPPESYQFPHTIQFEDRNPQSSSGQQPGIFPEMFNPRSSERDMWTSNARSDKDIMDTLNWLGSEGGDYETIHVTVPPSTDDEPRHVMEHPTPSTTEDEGAGPGSQFRGEEDDRRGRAVALENWRRKKARRGF